MPFFDIKYEFPLPQIGAPDAFIDKINQVAEAISKRQGTIEGYSEAGGIGTITVKEYRPLVPEGD